MCLVRVCASCENPCEAENFRVVGNNSSPEENLERREKNLGESAKI